MNTWSAGHLAFRKELLEPELILATDLSTLNLDELREHLIVLVHAEKDSCNPGAFLYQKLSANREDFKKERLNAAILFKSLGGKVSPLLLGRDLPSMENWPGMVRLVEIPGMEELFAVRDV